MNKTGKQSEKEQMQDVIHVLYLLLFPVLLLHMDVEALKLVRQNK